MRTSIDAFIGSANRKLKAFRNNCLGSVTQITAVAALPMLLAAGAAIDTVRINREQVAFDAAVDSAALAVAADDRASLAGLSDAQVTARIAELEEFAKKYMAENYTPQYGSSQEMEVDIDITGAAIDLTASHTFPTTIMSLTGIDEVNLSSHSQIMKAMRPIEMVLVMDTTGSMASSSKLAGAKTAARDLLNTVYGGSASSVPESEYLRVALVPFAAGVRLNPSAYDFNLNWIDTTGANPLSTVNFNDTSWNNYTTWGKLKKTSSTYQTWNGCVEARMRGDDASNTDYNVNDVAPTSGVTRFPAYFAPDSPSFGRFECLTVPIGTRTGADPIFLKVAHRVKLPDCPRLKRMIRSTAGLRIPPAEPGQISQPEHWQPNPLRLPRKVHGRAAPRLRSCR